MRHLRLVLALLPLVLLAAGPAAAQSVIRIGLNDDPDLLDPTVSRAYTGRLVFAALCDKLFDVTPDLKIVPQLATGYEWAADQRSVVILRDAFGFSYEEISRVARMPVGTAKCYVHRGRERLREQLAPAPPVSTG